MPTFEEFKNLNPGLDKARVDKILDVLKAMEELGIQDEGYRIFNPFNHHGISKKPEQENQKIRFGRR